jgi:hypothetical protein
MNIQQHSIGTIILIDTCQRNDPGILSYIKQLARQNTSYPEEAQDDRHWNWRKHPKDECQSLIEKISKLQSDENNNTDDR